MQGIVDGLRHTVFAFAESRRHDGHTAVFQNGADVTEVEVDDAVHGDDFSDASRSHAQSVVGLFEGAEHIEVGIDFAQAFVVDDEQGVNMF